MGNFGDYFKLTRKEYDASVNALNLFFGAVIGVSLGSIGDIDVKEYVMLLIATATAVTTILYVSYSERRYWSILIMVFVLAGIWGIGNADDNLFDLPAKLLPTLGVWAAMAVITEFSDIAEDGDELG